MKHQFTGGMSRRELLKTLALGGGGASMLPLLSACGSDSGSGQGGSNLAPYPLRIENAMWSWWTKPVVMRDANRFKNLSYFVFTEANGSVGLAVFDHNRKTLNRYLLSSAFTPDDHNAGCVVTGNGRVAVFMQGRNVIDMPGEKMFYIEFEEGQDPSGMPLQSFDMATAPNRSNYPNVFNSDGLIYALSRNQQRLGSQWHYVLGTWPLSTFSAPRTFFSSEQWTWSYFAQRRSVRDKDVFNFALGWHPFDGQHHDIYFGQIMRHGTANPWDVVSRGEVVGNLTTGEGLPFNENSFEKVFACPAGMSTRLFEVSDDSVVFAVFDPRSPQPVADYRYAVRRGGVWQSYSVCSGGLPFHGTGVRNYYGGMSISERNPFRITVAREQDGQWYGEEYQSPDSGQTWVRTLQRVAEAGKVIGRPMEEVASEEASERYSGELISTVWEGLYDPTDYTRFYTDVVSLRHPRLAP